MGKSNSSGIIETFKPPTNPLAPLTTNYATNSILTTSRPSKTINEHSRFRAYVNVKTLKLWQKVFKFMNIWWVKYTGKIVE